MRWSIVPLVACGFALAMPAGSPALTGLLHKAEFCTEDGGYASLGSIAVLAGGEGILVVDRSGPTPEVRRLTTSARLTKPFVPTGFPSDSTFGGAGSGSIILDRGPPGIVYVVDRFDFGRFYQASAGGAMQRDIRFGTDAVGPAGLRYNSLVGALASQSGELFLLDAGIVKVFDIASGRSLWSDDTEDGDPRGSTSVGITTMFGALAIAKTHGDGTPDRVSVFRRAGTRLEYGLSITVPPFLQDVAGNPDNTIWVLANHDLYRYNLQGDQLEAIETGQRGATAIDAGPDGTVWVTTSDGVLHIGPGGTSIPKLDIRAPCGPPRISTSFAKTQPVLRTGELVLKVRCTEPCSVKSSGRAEIPSGGRQYRLKSDTVRMPAGTRRRLEVGLPPRAVAALRRAQRRGRPSTVFLSLTATDAGGNRESVHKTLTIG